MLVCMSRPRQSQIYGNPVPLRLTQGMVETLKDAAQRLEMSEQQVMRLALEIGLKHLKRIDFQLADTVLAQSALMGRSDG